MQIEINDVTKLNNCDDAVKNEVVLRPNSDKTKQCRATWGIDSLNTSINVTLWWNMTTFLGSGGRFSSPLHIALTE